MGIGYSDHLLYPMSLLFQSSDCSHHRLGFAFFTGGFSIIALCSFGVMALWPAGIGLGWSLCVGIFFLLLQFLDYALHLV